MLTDIYLDSLETETVFESFGTQPLKFARVRAFASADTFDIKPIGELVRRYLRQSTVSIDPFARNKRWATYTNDLNPKTEAEYHLDAADFLENLVAEGVQADLMIFDPPYSPAQTKECYEGVGLKFGVEDVWRTGGWKRERKAIRKLVKVGGYTIFCGWNTNGMGEYLGFKAIELLDVCCGWQHYDIMVLVEQKIAHQMEMEGF